VCGYGDVVKVLLARCVPPVPRYGPGSRSEQCLDRRDVKGISCDDGSRGVTGRYFVTATGNVVLFTLVHIARLKRPRHCLQLSEIRF